jgi:hypothetical protein
MSLTVQQTQAVFQLYPQVTVIRGDIAHDAEGNEVQYDLAAVTEQAEKDACKAEAKQRLADTDWSVLPDVVVKNKLEFETYRSQIRALVLNPVAEPSWPTEPQPVWS